MKISIATYCDPGLWGEFTAFCKDKKLKVCEQVEKAVSTHFKDLLKQYDYKEEK